MRPAVIFGKARQEASGGDGAAGATADVLHVGEVAVQQRLVVFPQRQLPGAVVRLFTRIEQFLGKFVVIAEQAAGDMPQRDDTGAGEGGQVDDGIRFELRRVSQCVAQHQTALRIRVQYFDSLAGHRSDDVARLGGGAGRQVLTARNDTDHVQLQPHLGNGLHGAEHAGRTAHVIFHLVHFGAGLERDAAGIERDALADQHDGFLFLVRPVIFQRDQLGRLFAAARDGEESAHAQLAHILFFQHGGLDLFVRLAQCQGLGGEVGRGADIARQIAKSLGQCHAMRDGGGLRNDLLQLRRRLAQRGKGDVFQFRAVGGFAFQAVGAERLLGGDEHRLPQQPCRILPKLVCGQIQRSFFGRRAVQCLEQRLQNLDTGLGGLLVGLAQPDQQHALAGDTGQLVQQERGCGFAAHVALRDQIAQGVFAGFVQRLRRLR